MGRSTWDRGGTGTPPAGSAQLQGSEDTLNVTTAMIAFSLALFIVQIVAVVASASPSRRFSPPDQCQITLDSYRFNLCPLLDERHHSGQVGLVLHYQTPPTTTTIVYNISLNGSLRKSDAFPGDEQVSLAVANYGVQSNLFSVLTGPGLV